MVEKARIIIHEQGWVVQGVSDHGCLCCTAAGRTPRKTGMDPYLYTAGLTEVGLPELLLRLTGKNSPEWINTGIRMLNRIGRHSLHAEPELGIGQLVQTGNGGITATITDPPVFSRDTVWPGLAYELYGHHRPRFVEVLPSW